MAKWEILLTLNTPAYYFAPPEPWQAMYLRILRMGVTTNVYTIQRLSNTSFEVEKFKVFKGEQFINFLIRGDGNTTLLNFQHQFIKQLL